MSKPMTEEQRQQRRERILAYWAKVRAGEIEHKGRAEQKPNPNPTDLKEKLNKIAPQDNRPRNYALVNSDGLFYGGKSKACVLAVSRLSALRYTKEEAEKMSFVLGRLFLPMRIESKHNFKNQFKCNLFIFCLNFMFIYGGTRYIPPKGGNVPCVPNH